LSAAKAILGHSPRNRPMMGFAALNHSRRCSADRAGGGNFMRNTLGRRGRTFWTAALSALLVVTARLSAPALAQTPSACATRGAWIDVNTGQSIDRGDLFRDIVAKSSVVLLGESHTDADHHRWQLHTIAALHGRGGNIVIGFEAFPRRLQAVLDDWVNGKLTEDAFLKAAEWRQVWGYDAALYMPIFEFARLNRVPMIALNVERKLVSQVGEKGWEAVPVADREGLSDPAPASPAYQRELARVYLFKKTLPPGTDPLSVPAESTPKEPDEAAFAEALNEPEFKRFVAAQQTWDRGMAEALARAKRKFADATVIGILGGGHVEGGYGVPHQLKDLGITELKAFMPQSVDEACKVIGTAGYADAIFTLPPEDDTPPPVRPRLGVLLTDGDGAPRVSRVVNDSVADTAGVKAGDQIVTAAGLAIRTPDELVDVVGRQAPGTWLPLSIKRDGQEMDFVAKFPPRPRPQP
jgi:uncharacterized iron-regulated protein